MFGKTILEVWKANDFSLIAVVLLMPLLGAFVNGVFGRRLGKDAVRMMALVAVGISFAAAIVTLLGLNHVVDETATKAMVEGHEVTKHGHAKVSWMAWEWMRASGPHGAPVSIEFRFSVDALSGIMMLVVTGVGFLIHVYASSYMIEDKGYWRFFAYLNLFIFSMLVLILGDNLPVLFIGWEGVGLCSYLLIGFWYTKTPNAAAGKKAFIMNRIGDFGLLVGMFLLLQFTGALDWDGMAKNATNLLSTSRDAQVHLWPIGGGQFTDTVIAGITIPLSKLQPAKPVTMTAATAVALMLFLGCTGKSAQIPLYTWLPDAMAGPTPVSALIHAATMVTAGIYLICRMSFVFVLSPVTMTIIAFTGAATAVLAATIALVQNDIKKVLAYSTVSQLGFMFLGVGVGAFTAGFFHVFTHAFFKACLFLGAGSVIHAMHARVRAEDRSQDMRNMGGLKKYMPLTFWTFAISTAAIVGFPLSAGFFSKDEILAQALVSNPVGIQMGKTVPWTAPTWVPWVLWGMGTLAATMTAFYMCRTVFLTFFGEFKGWTVGRPSMLAKKAQKDSAEGRAEHGSPDGGEHDDDDHHHDDDLSQPGYPPHESPRAMTLPLIVLAVFAAAAGFLNPAALKLAIRSMPLAIETWLHPVFEEASRGVKPLAHDVAVGREWIATFGGLAAFAIGTYLAYWMYVQNAGKPAKQIALAWPRLYRWAYNKWFVDEAYDKSVVAGVDALADTASSVDQGLVDFVIARLTSLVVAASGTVLRVVQNGVVHVYAAVMVVGLAVLGWFFITPHADFSVSESASGDYSLVAAPGAGYGFKWYPDASKEAQQKDFNGPDNLRLHLDEGKSQTVKLEVRNAFGRTDTKEMVLKRPAADKPPPTAQIQLPGGQ